MKKLLLFITLSVLALNYVSAQTNYVRPSFNESTIKTSDLIVEGTITKISYFRDTTTAVKNLDFNRGLVDAKGIWFVKYEITVHKIFKGENLTKVSVVHQNYNFSPEIDSLIVYPRGLGSPIRGSQGNHGLYHTGIYFLNKSFTPALPFNTSFYYPNRERCSIGFYHLITESEIKIRDKEEVKEFETVEHFYKYLEKEIGKKRKDLTNKKFEVLNTGLKVNEYLKKQFNDSAYTDNYSQKIKEGKINQFNVDSFLVKPSPPLSKKKIKEDKRISDSIHRENKKRFDKNQIEFNKVIKIIKQRKQSSLNKSGENLTYTFSNTFYSKNGSDIFLEYDIVGYSNVSKYFAAIAININYKIWMKTVRTNYTYYIC